MHENYVEAAVKAAGTPARMARALGVSQQAVSMWLRRGWVSPRRAQEIEAMYGIARKQLMNPRLVDLVDSNVYDDFEA